MLHEYLQPTVSITRWSVVTTSRRVLELGLGEPDGPGSRNRSGPSDRIKLCIVGGGRTLHCDAFIGNCDLVNLLRFR